MPGIDQHKIRATIRGCVCEHLKHVVPVRNESPRRSHLQPFPLRVAYRDDFSTQAQHQIGLESECPSLCRARYEGQVLFTYLHFNFNVLEFRPPAQCPGYGLLEQHIHIEQQTRCVIGPPAKARRQ